MTHVEIKNPLFDNYNIVLTTAFIFLLVSLILSSTVLHPGTVFGDGLFMEELSASFGDRKADLIIKMTPPVVTTETLNQDQKPVIQFKLYDPATKEGFKHITYFITIEKDGKKLLPIGFMIIREI